VGFHAVQVGARAGLLQVHSNLYLKPFSKLLFKVYIDFGASTCGGASGRRPARRGRALSRAPPPPPAPAAPAGVSTPKIHAPSMERGQLKKSRNRNGSNPSLLAPPLLPSRGLWSHLRPVTREPGGGRAGGRASAPKEGGAARGPQRLRGRRARRRSERGPAAVPPPRAAAPKASAPRRRPRRVQLVREKRRDVSS
jgi:hypothetical protein